MRRNRVLRVGVFMAVAVALGVGFEAVAQDAGEVAGGLPAPGVLFEGFHVRASGYGFMNEAEVLAFLDTPVAAEADGEAGGLLARGWILGVIVILAGGFLLNLTPCVLPMVPVNLAIIGAGAKAGSRGRGFLLGGAYGAAMALVYGLLGLAVVLTGATFGTLNASPWFNGVIAVLFVVLALGMFDLLPIDFSRFQRVIGKGSQRGRFALAFGMGGVAALLAGACVAPVLISVLLLSADLYGRGVAAGLALPFLLGVGMGLPWPFAGAGMAFLPKPGRWMNVVKYAFGVLILVLAVYYGRLAWTLSRSPAPADPGGAAELETDDLGAIPLSAENSPAEWAAVLERAGAEGRPVFIDFWATWCRVCLQMQRTTFREPAVQERLADFVFIKYQAERPNASPTKEIFDYFGIIGLPTYLILDPAE